MTTTEYLQREIRRVELSIRRAERKTHTPPEELHGLHEKLEHLQEALEAVEERWQRVHEQRGWTAGEPMTLEQLRGAPHGKIRDKTLQHICVRANELAQAHSPAAHIDREKWEPCKFCRSENKAPLGFDSANDVVTIVTDNNAAAIEADSFGFIVGYCPRCGRPLTEEAWAKLERRVCGG